MGKNILTAASVFLFALSLHAQRPNQDKVMADKEITRILVAINEGEIAAAGLAKEKATSPEVRKFAETMMNDHTKNMAHGTAIADRNKLTPETNAEATKVKREADATSAKLKASKNFDKDYMDAQVKMHQDALNILSKEMIAKAQNPELKAFLETTRTAIEHHLAEAKTVQSRIK